MNRCIILVLLALSLVLTAKGGEEPEMLNIEIGGFDGTSYMLILTNGVLEYRAAESIFELRQTKAEVITPTESQWKAFRSSLDEIGVWNWKTTYVNPNVCDGTQWHVVLKYDAKSISTAGANAFPDGKEPNQSPPFQKLMVAVSKLLSGKEFR